MDQLSARQTAGWANSLEAPSPDAPQIVNAAFLHVNGSGDFTLLSRDDWFALRGYLEFPIWPMNTDSLFCYSAHHAGLTEYVLEEPMRIYHIEHSSGAGWTPEGEEERTARIQAKRVPVIEHADFVRWIAQMRRLNAPLMLNKENWGLAGEELPERIL